MEPSQGVTEVTPSLWKRLGVVHGLALLACLVLVGWHSLELRGWYENREQLTQVLRDLGLEEFNQTALRRISREKTPHQAQLIAARTIVHQVMSPDLDERGRPIIPRQQRLESLDQAEAMARQALLAESESWQAAMLVGASIYLRRSLGSDRRLITDSKDWEVPLRRAVDAAASKTEPRRILAAAYLETWPYLSAEKKELTQELLTHVFRNDEKALRRLIPVWLQVADSDEKALAVVPDDAEAWQFVKYTYGRALRWDAYAQAERRRYDALMIELTASLDEAEARKRLGDPVNSRELCLDVVARAPRQLRFVPLVERAMAIYPPGLHGLQSTAGLSDWLVWAVELDAVGVMPLAAQTINDLTDVAGPLETPIAAHAALLAGNVYNMRRFEKQTAHRATLSWSPFLLAKARRQAEAGELDEAERTFDDLNLASQRSYGAWRIQALLAAAREDDEALAAAEAEMAKAKGRRWSALAWNLRRQTASLFMVPAVAARGVRLEVVSAGPNGDAISVFLDGELVALEAMVSGQHYDLAFDIDAEGPHLLQVVSVSGQPTTLGSVELIE